MDPTFGIILAVGFLVTLLVCLFLFGVFSIRPD